MAVVVYWVLFIGLFVAVSSSVPLPAATVEYKVDLRTSTSPFPHVWERCVGSCHALTALRSDYREHLVRAHRDIGFQYIRFHGILDDDMSTYTIVNGVPTYSFFNMDSIFDFLLSIGMRPIVELSFMPELLASEVNETIFHYRGGISMPKSMYTWATFMETFVGHLVSRYGVSEVRNWWFEVWNEPNCGFLHGNQTDYFALYEATALAVKAVDPQLRVGGPVSCQSSWLTDFLNFVKAKQIPFDFVSTHEYPTDVETPTRDTMIGVVRKARQEVGSSIPLLYTEFNDGLYFVPPYHDVPYAAAFIAHNAIGMAPSVDVMSWWTFTDIFEEQGFASVPFGDVCGWGLLNRNGIAKPSYRSFQLLHSLGTRRFSMVPSTTSTTSGGVSVLNDAGDEVAFLMYNFDVPTRTPDTVSISLRVSGVTKDIAATASLTVVDEGHSNPITSWIQMGSPTYLTSQQLNTLSKASDLTTTPLSYRRVSDDIIEIPLSLTGQSVALITLKLK